LKEHPEVDTDSLKKDMLRNLFDLNPKPEGAAHVQTMKDWLSPLFAALPQTPSGGLSHTEVRYVLHRIFMQRYTWFFRGLEPGAGAPDAAAAPLRTNFTLGTAPVWPSMLQGFMEQLQGNRGLKLDDVARLAAALEDVVHHETLNRLSMAYDGAGFSADTALNPLQLSHVLNEYMLLYNSGWNMTDMTHEELRREEGKHLHTGRWQSKLIPWLHQVQKDTIQTQKLPQTGLAFEDVAKIAGEVGKQFWVQNNEDCDALKKELMTMEDRKLGRVRLSDFYNKSRHSRWAFTEKVEYLRTLGALDETNVTNPLVITTNYITAMPQCLKASSLYVVCCPNECETLTGNLERAIAAPHASMDRVLTIAKGLTS